MHDVLYLSNLVSVSKFPKDLPLHPISSLFDWETCSVDKPCFSCIRPSRIKFFECLFSLLVRTHFTNHCYFYIEYFDSNVVLIAKVVILGLMR